MHKKTICNEHFLWCYVSNKYNMCDKLDYVFSVLVIVNTLRFLEELLKLLF